MDCTSLGTGSAMVPGGRAQTGLLVRGEGALLVDCGSGVLSALAETDVGYAGLDAVLLSHHHLDHVADLLPLLKARWLADCDTLPVVGPPGTRGLLDGALDAHDYLRGRVDVEVREVGPGQFAVADFSVRATETRHSTQCFAYRIDDLTVSGDTEPVESLADFADGSTVFVHECSFPDDVTAENHTTPAMLGNALAGHDYGTVYLTHLYPQTEGRHEELVASVRERYDGTVEVARDGLTVAV
ncbi:MAG: MBL fold metallo-hydrolase [Halobacteriaceae archaeon]